ncbi:MAG: CHASE2 domain-containing protein, partial [Burkholderiales bacterium]|nr:CHASE2 domain-containing protein [Burkholderiales bacterium]
MNNRVPWLRSPAVICFLLANLVFALLLGLREMGMLQPVELLTYDFGLRAKPAKAIDDRLIMIGFTEDDIHALGYPASDDVLAGILERLTQYQARAIGVDIYRDIPVPPGTERLAGILKKNPDIVWITKLGRKDTRVLPPKALEGSDQIGFNDMVDDPGGKIRRGLLFMDDGKNSYTSLSLQLALRYLQPMGIGLQPDPKNKDFVRLFSKSERAGRGGSKEDWDVVSKEADEDEKEALP